jgi:hypothetical protein
MSKSIWSEQRLLSRSWFQRRRLPGAIDQADDSINRVSIFLAHKENLMKKFISTLVLAALLFGFAGSLTAQAQSPVEQPPAKLVVDPPVPDLLAKGLVAIQYRTENIRILPVFGPDALKVSPRIGHMHITVDDIPLVWGNTSGEPVIINSLPAGPHKIGIALTDANHKVVAQEAVKFEVPRRPALQPTATVSVQSPKPSANGQAPAKIIIEPLEQDKLAKGLLYLYYRTENLQIAPVFGPDALKITPRLGHLHVRLDDTPWYWTYASGQPVIVAGLSPGSHRIAIDVVDANHQVLTQSVIEFEVPKR